MVAGGRSGRDDRKTKYIGSIGANSANCRKRWLLIKSQNLASGESPKKTDIEFMLIAYV
jgi:hypothetical protein